MITNHASARRDLLMVEKHGPLLLRERRCFGPGRDSDQPIPLVEVRIPSGLGDRVPEEAWRALAAFHPRPEDLANSTLPRTAASPELGFAQMVGWLGRNLQDIEPGRGVGDG